jgi:hypothetical protein
MATYKTIPKEYQIENTSWRVLKLILGNTKLSNKWWELISSHPERSRRVTVPLI